MTIIMPLRKDRDSLSCTEHQGSGAAYQAAGRRRQIRSIPLEKGAVLCGSHCDELSVSARLSNSIEHFSEHYEVQPGVPVKEKGSKVGELLRETGSFLLAGMFGALFVAGLVFADSHSDVSPSREELVVSSLQSGLSPGESHRFPRY